MKKNDYLLFFLNKIMIFDYSFIKHLNLKNFHLKPGRITLNWHFCDSQRIFLLFLFALSMLIFASGRIFAAAAETALENDETSIEYKEAFLTTNSEINNASAIIENFLKSTLAGDKSYERYVTPEIGDECINNFYMIDRNIIKNYKCSIKVNNYGEAACLYEGDDETIKQEFNLIKTTEGALKINSISEKRYIKMNAGRRTCYLNTRAVYKAASLLPVLYPNMLLPDKVDFDLLETKKLLKEKIVCPQGGKITISIEKNNDSQNYEVIARCSLHGDFFELYKLDDKISLDYDNYNKQIDHDEQIVLKRIGGDLYSSFLKLQPIEDAFYAQYERQNVSEMNTKINQALAIDKRLGNMYLTMIRAYRAADDEKSAHDMQAAALKVYPECNELKNIFNEKKPSFNEESEEEHIEE